MPFTDFLPLIVFILYTLSVGNFIFMLLIVIFENIFICILVYDYKIVSSHTEDKCCIFIIYLFL